MKKQHWHRGCRIDVEVEPTSDREKLSTSYTVTPESDDAKSVYGQFRGDGRQSWTSSHSDIDQFNGPDPIGEAIEFTISQANEEIDQVYATIGAPKAGR